MNTKVRYNMIRLRNILASMSPFIYMFIIRMKFLFYDMRKIEKHGLQTPLPSWMKSLVLKGLVLEAKPDIFIETGTYLGDTPWMLRKIVREIITIEVDHALADEAKRRFRKCSNIQVIEGDSGRILLNMSEKLKDKNLFIWLDGHYSSGITGMGTSFCPIREELDATLPYLTSNSMVIIDDARCFNGIDGYPTSLELNKICEKYNVTMSMDRLADHFIIRKNEVIA